MSRRLFAVSWCVLACAAPPPAHALAPSQVVAVASGYVVSEVVVLQGGTLTLTNADNAQAHDLVSLDRGPGGSYRFRAPVIGFGQQAVVAGVEALPPSTYPFLCSVHEYMTGNITVQAVG